MAFWIALGVLVVAVCVGLAIAIVRGIGTWRQLKSTGQLFTAELERISRASAEIDVHLARATASSERLGEAQDRLQASRSKLEVQLAAIREARAQLARAFWFLPVR